MNTYIVTHLQTFRRRVLVEAPDENTAADMVQSGLGEVLRDDLTDETYDARLLIDTDRDDVT